MSAADLLKDVLCPNCIPIVLAYTQGCCDGANSATKDRWWSFEKISGGYVASVLQLLRPIPRLAQPTLDCFAGHAQGQHQVARFYSKRYGPEAVAVNAMYQA